MCNRPAESVDLQVIREPAPAVDLDHGEPLAVLGLERLVAADVHLAQGEIELLLQLPQPCNGDLAEVAPLRVVDDDFGYG